MVPLNTAVSEPAPPSMVSFPAKPLITSLPSRPLMTSAPDVPVRVSAPAVPLIGPPTGSPAALVTMSENCSRSTLLTVSVPSGPAIVVTPPDTLIV